MPASDRPYMGAIPYTGGCTFRVWAPFAAQVSVAGDFNSWSADSNPLFSERNGYWSVEIPGAGVGQQYKFIISNAGQPPLWRNDPYARSISDDSGAVNSLIVSSSDTYPTTGYSMPPWPLHSDYSVAGLKGGLWSDAYRTGRVSERLAANNTAFDI